MISLWSSYLGPLLGGILFAVAGVAAFIFACVLLRTGGVKKPAFVIGCGGILFCAVGTAFVFNVLLSSPTPSQRADIFNHIYKSSPDRIVRFVIKGDSTRPKPLTNRDVVIDDPVRIRRIADILQAAHSSVPSKSPGAIWKTQVEMVTPDGSYYFGVTRPPPDDDNGTVVSIYSNPAGDGWYLDSARADGLETILEGAARAAKAGVPRQNEVMQQSHRLDREVESIRRSLAQHKAGDTKELHAFMDELRAQLLAMKAAQEKRSK